MKDVVRLLKAWFARINCAVWLHPEFDASRRIVIFGAATFVAAAMICQVPEFATEIDEYPMVWVRGYNDKWGPFRAAPWKPNMKFVGVAGGYFVEDNDD